MKKIYNKNAREKALLEEAYSNVYKETDEETLTEAVPLVPLAMAAPAAIPVAKKFAEISPVVQTAKSLMGSDEEVSDPENISGERWSEEYPISDLKSTEDLVGAEEGDAFLFDKVDEFAQAEGEIIETESDVMKFLSQFGSWQVKDNQYGAIVIKISHETGLTDAKGRPVQYSGGFMSM